MSLLPLDGLELVRAQQAQNCHAQDGEGAREDEEAALPCRTHGRPVPSWAVRRRSVIENGVQSKKSGGKLRTIHQSDSENQGLWRGGLHGQLGACIYVFVQLYCNSAAF